MKAPTPGSPAETFGDRPRVREQLRLQPTVTSQPLRYAPPHGILSSRAATEAIYAMSSKVQPQGADSDSATT
jgi:hypothetical protein